MRPALALVLAAAVTAGAARAEPAAPISQVYETSGDVEAITRRALTCVPKFVSPMKVDGQVIQTSDVAGGIVVANNVFTFPERQYTARLGRSVMTVEAKPGRFRITHDQIESPDPFDQWAPRRSKAMDAKLAEITEKVATCMQAPATDW